MQMAQIKHKPSVKSTHIYRSLTNCSENFCASYPALQNLQNRINERIKEKCIWSGSKPCARIIRPSFSRMQPACHQFPTFRLGCAIPQTAWIVLRKTSPAPIWFWLTVSGFSLMDLVRKQAGVQESLGPLLANASEPDRIGGSVFAGDTLYYPTVGSTVYLLIALTAQTHYSSLLGQKPVQVCLNPALTAQPHWNHTIGSTMYFHTVKTSLTHYSSLLGQKPVQVRLNPALAAQPHYNSTMRSTVYLIMQTAQTHSRSLTGQQPVQVRLNPVPTAQPYYNSTMGSVAG